MKVSLMMLIGAFCFYGSSVKADCAGGEGDGWENHANGCKDTVTGLVWTYNQTTVLGGAVMNQGSAVARCANTAVFSDGSGRLPAESEASYAVNSRNFNAHNDMTQNAGGYNWTSTPGSGKKCGGAGVYYVFVPAGSKKGGYLLQCLGQGSTINAFCVKQE